MAKGTYIAAIALVHLLAGLLYKDEIAAIFRDAIVDSVPDFGDRAAAFWFFAFGVLLVVLGLSIARATQRSCTSHPHRCSPGQRAASDCQDLQ
jgi:hypothetical protein